MANPLSDLWQKLISTVYPDITPGPDVRMDTSLSAAGRYEPEGAIHKLASTMAPGLFHPGGLVLINPDHTAHFQTTIQHEKVHALLNTLNSNGTLDKLNASNPYFKQVASKLILDPTNDPSSEAPAYIATGESKQVGIDPEVANGYKQHLIQQLQTIDPHTAKAYSDLSQ